MPITIQPTANGFVGPGLQLSLSSDFIGPIGTDGHFTVGFSLDEEGSQLVWQEIVPSQLPQISVVPLSAPVGSTVVHLTPYTVDAPTSGFVQAQLTSNSSTVDSGTQAATWSPTAGLGMQAQLLQGGPSTGGGLTTEQAQQLLEVHQATAPAISLDALLLTDLTGGVPSDFVAAQLPNAIFGVIVRLTSIPPDLATIGADANYWRTTLAVVNIFRGSDLWIRAPIHTSNRIVPLPQEGLATTAAEDELTAWLLQLSLQVTFFPGCLGEVFLMKYP